jgi:superfamily I DNA and/or RNA helicase
MRAVIDIIQELTKGDVYWTDEDDIVSPLTLGDIKVISPYNAQVIAIADSIPGLLVGTVDKFQGQEAAVVIYSMATSTPEEAPRGMDFLYSPNRLNVAVSRARAMFIMVANPSIFSPECKSPQQIRLANPFCEFQERMAL